MPVLILTARDDEVDNGLGAGADDYMTKPFSMRELIACCKVLLRRVDRAGVIVENSETRSFLDWPGCRSRATYRHRQWQAGAPDLYGIRFAGHAGPQASSKATREKLLEEVWDLGGCFRHSHRRFARQGTGHKLGSKTIRTGAWRCYVLNRQKSKTNALKFAGVIPTATKPALVNPLETERPIGLFYRSKLN